MILVADDDPQLLQTLALALELDGHKVISVADGGAALARIEAGGITALISDVNMPRLDGFSLCRTLRERGHTLPILLLTSRDGEIDEALGLDLGADDYLTKPCSLRILRARLRALLRRARPPAAAPAPDEETIERHALRVDLSRLTVHFQDQPLTVTVTEIRLLAALMRHPGRVYSRERLLARAREDEDSVVAPRLIDTYIARLRRKLRAIDPDSHLIETVVGAGYRLAAADG